MTAGTIADKIGRISVMKIAAVLFLISAFGTGFAHEVWTVVLFRIVGGIGVGVASVIAPCLHRRDVTSADPWPARLAAAVGDRVRHLPVVRHQLPAAIAGGRTERSVVARASTPGVGCSSRWRCPPSSTGCWPSRSPSRRGIWLPATRFRKRGGCSTCCWARRTSRSPSTGSRNPSSGRTSRRCAT